MWLAKCYNRVIFILKQEEAIEGSEAAQWMCVLKCSLTAMCRMDKGTGRCTASRAHRGAGTRQRGEKWTHLGEGTMEPYDSETEISFH